MDSAITLTTPLAACSDGVADWVRMFGSSMTTGVPPARLGSVLDRVNELAAPDLLRDGVWIADYWRLRFVAVLDA